MIQEGEEEPEIQDSQPHAAAGKALILSYSVNVLFDTGATCSFISRECVDRIGLSSATSDLFIIRLPNGDTIKGTYEVRQCPIDISDRPWPIDMLIAPLYGEDIILGMDWLWKYSAIIDIRGMRILVVALDKSNHQIQVCRVQGGNLRIRTLTLTSIGIEEIPVVCEFPDVFPDELPRLPPRREIDFTIELEHGTEPISKTPYRMSKPELEELKNN